MFLETKAENIINEIDPDKKKCYECLQWKNNDELDTVGKCKDWRACLKERRTRISKLENVAAFGTL